MENLMIVRSRIAVAGFALVLASAVIGRAATIHVPADYATIQAAVDAAASGDEIQIAPGVYTNQVVITNKSLALSGPGAVLRATPGMSPHPLSISGWVPLVAVGLTDVVISGLTLEGEHLGDSQSGPFEGIYFIAAGGRIENCRITGFRGSTLGSAQAYGVRAVNPPGVGPAQEDVQVLRSIFADNAISIEVAGAGSPSTNTINFGLNDNTIIGNGPDTTGRQTGISIRAGVGGEVKRNTITDHLYASTNDPNPFSFGILGEDASGFPLAALQPVHFEGNILRDNKVDLFLARGDGSTIVNNSFEGFAPGYRPIGLAFSGENVLVGTNRFSDMDTGIVLIGDDPDFGTYFGIASNAVLTANGFCNVATNYVYEPLTSHTEQDTLTCPWPQLDIRAVQLSWPYSDNGYSVETAPTVEGPWTTSDVTPFLQGGQNSAVIPADSDQQYFRLVKP
jgi:hypothetical protein